MFCFGVRYRLVVFKICSNMLATKWYDRIVYINSFDYLVLISSLYNATSITVIPQTRYQWFRHLWQSSLYHIVSSFFFNSQYKSLLIMLCINHSSSTPNTSIYSSQWSYVATSSTFHSLRLINSQALPRFLDCHSHLYILLMVQSQWVMFRIKYECLTFHLVLVHPQEQICTLDTYKRMRRRYVELRYYTTFYILW